jgi:IclR family KDG regulon transcriptional repressor
MRIPVFAGVAGKALLSQLPEKEIDEILSENTPKRFTGKSITDRAAYRNEILTVKETGIAYDREEYIEGLIAVAVPIQTYRADLQATIWAVGLKQEFRKQVMMRITDFFLNIAKEINCRFAMFAGHSCQMSEMPAPKDALATGGSDTRASGLYS